MINWNEIYTAYLQGAKPLELATEFGIDIKKINAKYFFINIDFFISNDISNTYLIFLYQLFNTKYYEKDFIIIADNRHHMLLSAQGPLCRKQQVLLHRY